MGQPLTVDDVVAMMSVMDADGDGEVTKEEFCSYYQRLKRCGEAELEAQWKRMDVNADGILTVSELCSYHGIDAGQCSEALQRQRGMDDEQTLLILQREYEVNESRVKEEERQRTHANRLRALAELAAAASDGEDGVAGDVASPTTASNVKSSSPLTMADIMRDSKRPGDLASQFYE